MGRSNRKPSTAEFVMFDVLYDDGTRTSNRKVPTDEMDMIDGDASAKAIIEAQDRRIGELSGRPRGQIKSINRSGR